MQFMDVLTLFAGLALFLYGIKEMGEGLEKAAGHRMQRLLEVLTKNKFSAVLVGALVTGVIQSSSATTVMVVGFVNAGLLPLRNAIGVIMGANIGTTVTSLMLSVKLDFGVIFAVIGLIFLLVSGRSNFKMLGQIFIGLGILFVGMKTMTGAMEPMRDWEGFRTMITGVSNPFLGVLIGALITALLQSSSASIGILQALASANLIGLHSSLFILFGQNIGTCITAMLASIGTNKTARRAAVVHLLFNIIGSALFIFIALTLPFADWIESLAGDNLRLQIAFAHIIFNVTTTIILLPMSKLLEKAAYFIVRGQDKQEEPMRLTFFDDRLFSTPPIAAKQLFREVMRMSELVKENFTFAMDYFFKQKDIPLDEFDNRENVIDYLNTEVTAKLIELRSMTLGSRDVHLMGSLFHVVNDLERIGDHCVNITEIADARRTAKKAFTNKAIHEIETLYATVNEALDQAIEIVNKQIIDPAVIKKVSDLEDQIDTMCDDMTDRHMNRVKAKKCSPTNGMLFLDLLNNLERIGDHTENLATSVDEHDDEGRKLLW
ncbi:MAG TPA: Na/Pi cotransporter family protein [Candidatus Limiplasma sp.]|nr:Na/Pi cotransporter family protein [Candidatus Limiplasma sp.]